MLTLEEASLAKKVAIESDSTFISAPSRDMDDSSSSMEPNRITALKLIIKIPVLIKKTIMVVARTPARVAAAVAVLEVGTLPAVVATEAVVSSSNNGPQPSSIYGRRMHGLLLIMCGPPHLVHTQVRLGLGPMTLLALCLAFLELDHKRLITMRPMILLILMLSHNDSHTTRSKVIHGHWRHISQDFYFR